MIRRNLLKSGLAASFLPSTISLGQEAARQAPAKQADPPPKVDKEAGTFKDGKRGDVPEGAAEMVTPAVERAVRQGLDWLVRQQSEDGSF
ncbi:MAG: hypothetical protein ACKO0V_24330, partial [bacterium]